MYKRERRDLSLAVTRMTERATDLHRTATAARRLSGEEGGAGPQHCVLSICQVMVAASDPEDQYQNYIGDPHGYTLEETPVLESYTLFNYSAAADAGVDDRLWRRSLSMPSRQLSLHLISSRSRSWRSASSF
jgi:hypothetical protein